LLKFAPAGIEADSRRSWVALRLAADDRNQERNRQNERYSSTHLITPFPGPIGLGSA
jgi:hypothetical protein